MAGQWYYTRTGERYGPVTTEELKQLVSTGELVPADLVWNEGMAAWTPISKVRGLLPGERSGGPPPLPAKRDKAPAPLDFSSAGDDDDSMAGWSARERNAQNSKLQWLKAGMIASAVIGVICLVSIVGAIFCLPFFALTGAIYFLAVMPARLHGRWVPSDETGGWVEFLSGGIFKRHDGVVGTFTLLPNQKFIDIHVSDRLFDSWKVLAWSMEVLEVQDSAGKVKNFKKGKTLAEKQASFFYTDRSKYLYGSWQPLTTTGEWVQFTEDGGVVFSDGSAGRYSFTGEEPNEFIEIEMVGGLRRKFKVISLSTSQLVIAEGGDTTTFRRPGKPNSSVKPNATGSDPQSGDTSGGASKGFFGSLWAFLTRIKCPKCGQRSADQTHAEPISDVTQQVESRWDFDRKERRQWHVNVWIERRTFCCEECKHKWQEDHRCSRIA